MGVSVLVQQPPGKGLVDYLSEETGHHSAIHMRQVVERHSFQTVNILSTGLAVRILGSLTPHAPPGFRFGGKHPVGC